MMLPLVHNRVDYDCTRIPSGILVVSHATRSSSSMTADLLTSFCVLMQVLLNYYKRAESEPHGVF
jgi:hypothetical protein